MSTIKATVINVIVETKHKTSRKRLNERVLEARRSKIVTMALYREDHYNIIDSN